MGKEGEMGWEGGGFKFQRTERENSGWWGRVENVGAQKVVHFLYLKTNIYDTK